MDVTNEPMGFLELRGSRDIIEIFRKSPPQGIRFGNLRNLEKNPELWGMVVIADSEVDLRRLRSKLASPALHPRGITLRKLRSIEGPVIEV